MKKILNYFIGEQVIGLYEKQKTNAFIIFSSIIFILIISVIIQTIIYPADNSLTIIVMGSVMELFVLISFFILKKKGIKTAGNVFSVVLILLISLALNNLDKDVSVLLKYTQGFYTIMGIFAIAVLFASRKILIVNIIIILFTTTRVYLFALQQSPEKAELFTTAYIHHTITLVALFAILYFAMEFAEKAIEDAREDTRIKAVQNQELIASEEEIRASMEELRATTDALKESNGELTFAKGKAEESDKLKSVFLTNMSHEIRTPLNGIIGFSNLLNSQEQTDKKGKYFTEIISKSGEQLLKIIDDIIEISQLETQQVKISTSKVNINYLLINLIEEYRYSTDKKGIELVLETNLSDDDSTIYTDEPKLLKILTNLIENAIKFTKKGFVKVKYDVKNEMLAFDIEDTGIGFEQGNTFNIFDRFVQANEGISFDFGGLGLGLTIAKLNTELLGGKINAKSELEKGSTFDFNIPYKPAILKKEITKEEEKAKNKGQIKECKILIVEDEEVNFLFIKEILKKTGIKCKILEATNGQEAVDIFTNNPDIDLVLMDLKMPVMDGYKATKIIKDIKPEVPIIIQTAYTLEEERKKSADAGCDGFITKPIKIKEFKEVLSQNLKVEFNSV